MLTYTYYCEANKRTIEVAHSMNDNISSWGALCQLAGIEVGNTPPNSPITAIISGGYLALSSRDKDTPPDSCCARPDSCLPMASSADTGHCCGSSCCCKG